MIKIHALVFLILFLTGLTLLSGSVYASTQEASTNSSSEPVCGNGAVESGEQCDAGGSNGACPATCSASCTTNSCGGGSGGGGVSTNNTAAKITDFNSDGRVNILDLSILLYFIEQPSLAISHYDLNKDNKIDFIDISILFYYWDT